LVRPGTRGIQQYPDLARLFFSRGADVNFEDNTVTHRCYSPLQLDYGDSPMLNLLLASGARIDARNKQGETALDLARKYGHKRFIESLTKAASAK
jgi:ankyrin repeat protein